MESYCLVMDPAIEVSLTNAGLEDCIPRLVEQGITTCDQIKSMKTAAVIAICDQSYETADLFNEWRSQNLANLTPKRFQFWSKLNTDTQNHDESVLVRIDLEYRNDNSVGERQCAIRVSERMMSHLLQRAVLDYVPMVSLVGGTGVGKSFITTSFFGERSDRASLPVVAEPEQTIPTTAHVSKFRGQLRDGTPMNILDLEGESGGTPKTLVNNIRGYASNLYESAKSLVVGQTAGRKEIIKHTMPRMAYFVSDVIIFLDVVKLHRDEMADRVRDFAMKAHRSCNSVGWKPALIILRNQWVPSEEDPFLADQSEHSSYAHIKEGLAHLFSDIAFMQIPHSRACSAEFLHSCIDQLHSKIRTFIDSVKERRKANNCLYSEHRTLHLFREIVKWVADDPMGERPIQSLTDLNGRWISKESIENCVLALKSYPSYEDDPAQFEKNVTKVLEWFAYIAATDLKLDIHSTAKDFPAMHAAVLSKCYAEEQCTEIIHQGNTKFPCRRKKGEHDGFHSNPAVIQQPNSNLFKRTVSLGLWTESAVVCSPGAFSGGCSSSLVKPAHSQDRFVRLINAFARADDELFLKEFVRIQPASLWENSNAAKMCMLCLATHSGSVVSLPACQHALCGKCVDKRKSLMPDLKKDTGSIICPFCNAESKLTDMEPEKFVGYRILSLDGGGVKGLIEVMVLQKLEVFFAPLKITSLFEVIVGTSAGGIIAMALLKGDITLEQLGAFLEETATEILDANSFLRFLRLAMGQSQCSTSAMNSAMQETFGTDLHLGYHFSNRQPPYIFCTAFDKVTEKAVLLGNQCALNYASSAESGSYNEALRAYVHSPLLWEAARATSAAPTFFDPVPFSNSTRDFSVLDGAVPPSSNCPAHFAGRLARVLQGDHGSIDMCLSLGAGLAKTTASTVNGNVLDIAYYALNSAFDSERKWEEYFNNSAEFKDVQDRIRINPPDLGSLDPFSSASIPQIKTGMASYFASELGMHAMNRLYHMMYAKLWHFQQTENLVQGAPFRFVVTLRDHRVTFDAMSDQELRSLITSRGSAVPSSKQAGARVALVKQARDCYDRQPVVAPMIGGFECVLGDSKVTSADRSFTLLTAGLVSGPVCMTVNWVSEFGSFPISGFPRYVTVLSEDGKE